MLEEYDGTGLGRNLDGLAGVQERVSIMVYVRKNLKRAGKVEEKK